ncbi:hypothetical protein ANCDUO_03691 [Ancylostoma duodenale]|uniref:Leishmanolysin-like peptidase n=1 Tax=Ancylostoma duodenale TaxID=51022 RepID=A0A0C2H392_9BILA|nr:hypothetical protein ANCDUO_03691 [Ancylostoma duodenale]
MCAVATTYNSFSRITLALFEDSGWYKVNYNNADEMLFGRGLGCNFAKQSCLSWIKTNKDDPYPFCNVLDDTRHASCIQTRIVYSTTCTLS